MSEMENTQCVLRKLENDCPDPSDVDTDITSGKSISCTWKCLHFFCLT